MTENEMTVLELDAAANIDLSNILYLIQGTGENRDRKMNLEQLRDFIQSKLTEVNFTGTNSSVSLDYSGLSFEAGENDKADFGAEGGAIESANYKLEYSAEEIKITNKAQSGGSISIKKDGVTINSAGGSVNVSNSGVEISDTSGNTTTATAAQVSAPRVKTVQNIASGARYVANGASFDLTSYRGQVGDIVVVSAADSATGDTTVQFTWSYDATTYKTCALKPGCALAFMLKTFVSTESRGVIQVDFVPLSNVTITRYDA